MTRSALTIALAPALLSACAAQGSFPSLAPRPIEREYAEGAAPPPCPDLEAPAPAPQPVEPTSVASDPVLNARVQELLAEARAGQREFQERFVEAGRAAARAGAPESESWIAAQQEISRLEAARARTANALSELETLAIRRSAGSSLSETDYAVVLAAVEEARSLAAAQEVEIDRISGGVSAP